MKTRHMDEKICRICGELYTPRSGTSVYCDACCSIHYHKHRCKGCGKKYYSRVESPIGLCRDCTLGGRSKNTDVICPCCGIYPIARDKGLSRLCWTCYTTGNDGVPEEFCNVGVGEVNPNVGELGGFWGWI